MAAPRSATLLISGAVFEVLPDHRIGVEDDGASKRSIRDGTWKIAAPFPKRDRCEELFEFDGVDPPRQTRQRKTPFGPAQPMGEDGGPAAGENNCEPVRLTPPPTAGFDLRWL